MSPRTPPETARLAFVSTRVAGTDGVSLEIPSGCFYCIMGPSGSGKSTFLNMIGALDRPTSGEVIFNGKPLSAESNLDRLRAQQVGFIFQLHNLMPMLTAAENVEIPMFAVGTPRRDRRQKATMLLDMVGLSHRMNSIATKLSAGERQRVAIARALANSPSLILADEPTGDVDSVTGEQIMETLQDVRKRSGATLVVVTHDPDVATGSDKLLRMKDGRFREDV